MASIRKRNGKFQVQVRRTGQSTVSRSFNRLADAKEWARLKEAQADRQELAPSRKELATLKLSDLVIRYRDEVVPTKRGAEVERIILNAFLRHPICNKRLSELTTADFASYRDERLQAITSKSLKRQLSPVSNMFEVAASDWQLPLKENPLAKLTLRAIDNKRERRLRNGEWQRLLEAAKTTRNPNVIPIIRFALETAMRRGEILALRWSDIDIERQSATITESKNGYSRAVPLTKTATSILIEAKQLTDDSANWENEPVFPVTANGFKLAWKRLVNRAGIRDLHFHDLRHEAISRLFELGLTVPEVGSISGHRDMRMLFRYAHANHASIRVKLDKE